MARMLPKKDAVIIGLGWTGSILAQQLTDAGLNVVAIERGPWRDTSTDFNIAYMQDELRYAIRKDLFLKPSVEAMTMRNSLSQTALPMRDYGSFLPGDGVGGGCALERPYLAVLGERFPDQDASHTALWRRQDQEPAIAGLGRDLE